VKLPDIAQVIRGTNACPRRLTLGVMIANDADWLRRAPSMLIVPPRSSKIHRGGGESVEEATCSSLIGFASPTLVFPAPSAPP
jgi:hypothetical protein